MKGSKGKKNTSVSQSRRVITPVSVEMAEVKSQLSQFYANKNILITGGAGFIGKLLIEKILRSCPDVKGIYLILRHKKDTNPETRLENVLKNPVSIKKMTSNKSTTIVLF